MRDNKRDDKGKKSQGGDKRRSRHLEKITHVEPKDIDFLGKFMTEHGKILAARLTGATPVQQRQIKRAIRRARVMGLLR